VAHATIPTVERLAEEVVAAERLSVLVVESDEAVRSTVVEGLRDSGFLVDAIDGADRIADWRGDVIVTDTFTSPYYADALVTYLKDLRSRYTAGLVVLTAHNGASVDASQLPADAVVMKPFDLDHLVRVVTMVARQRREQIAPNAVG
jgi:CheY-like chemotaxis protein